MGSLGVSGKKNSSRLFEHARELIPGGVNSPVRAFKSVDMEPIFINRGLGSHIWDVEGREYIDYVLSWGPLILGHSHPEIVEALRKCIEKGTSFGAPTELEVELAEMLVAWFPSIEMVRLVNSGTEATMSAIRLARGATGRDKIVKFEGCYHGHADSLLVAAGSGAATFGVPDSAGVPNELAKLTITLPYNDLDALRKVFEKNISEIACVIIEPVPGNMGVVVPNDGYLQEVRALTEKHGTVLIFDEVMSGFRAHKQGAQGLYGIMPDITCLGKVVGGGLPIGAYGGKKSLMEHISPVGDVYQAGTLSGNPLAVTAGIKSLELLSQDGVYKNLEDSASAFGSELENIAKNKSYPLSFNRVGTMMSMFFTDCKVVDYTTAKKSDVKKFATYFGEMIKRGINLAPSQFEALFLSTMHDDDDLSKTLSAVESSLDVVFGKE